MPQTVSIRVGESGIEFERRYPGVVNVTHQPAGIAFYSVDWDTGPRGIVRVESGRRSFSVQDVIGLQAAQDVEAPAEGLRSVTVYAGLAVAAPGLIAHDEANRRIHAILRTVMDAGWVQVIERSEPRLRGKARLDYMFAHSSAVGLDAEYIPTLEEWMRVESRTPWGFFADGTFLEVDFTREPSLRDPASPGSYLLTFSLKTASEYFKGFADPANRSQWKLVVAKELEKAQAARTDKEAVLRRQSIPIDESYQDPPAPPFLR